MTGHEVTDTPDTGFALYAAVTVVGGLIMLFGILGSAPLRVGQVLDFIGSYAVVYGVISLFDYLSPTRFAVLAYLAGGDPRRVPRWLYAGLIVGILAEVGGLVLLYHAEFAPSHGAEPLEDGVSCVLLGLGLEPLRYSGAFLHGYWWEG